MQTEQVFCGLDENEKPIYEDRVVHGTRPHAFRCMSCGHLMHAEHAGECETPHACPCCKAGVVFGMDKDKLLADFKAKRGDIEFVWAEPFTGIFKIVDHPNWEVLHAATDERLKELGLNHEQVAKHTPAPKVPNTPKMITRGLQDGPKTQDKAG